MTRRTKVPQTVLLAVLYLVTQSNSRTTASFGNAASKSVWIPIIRGSIKRAAGISPSSDLQMAPNSIRESLGLSGASAAACPLISFIFSKVFDGFGN